MILCSPGFAVLTVKEPRERIPAPASASATTRVTGPGLLVSLLQLMDLNKVAVQQHLSLTLLLHLQKISHYLELPDVYNHYGKISKRQTGISDTFTGF